MQNSQDLCSWHAIHQGWQWAFKLHEAQNLNIDRKRLLSEQNVSRDNVLPLETFHITPRRHIC